MYRVLHINDSWEGGGAEAVFRDTIKISQELGFENDVLIAEGKRNVFTYIYSCSEYKRVKERILFFKPDVIHIHNYYHYLSPSILMAIKRLRDSNLWLGRVIFTAHDYHLICPNSGLQFYENETPYNFLISKNNFSYLKKFDRRGYIYSTLKLLQHVLCYKIFKLNTVIDKIISPSHFLKEVFQNWGVTCPIDVIRNPIASRNFKLIERKVGTEGASPIKLVFMGRVTEEKGILNFINIIQKSKFDIDFHIFGEGDLLNNIKELTLRSGLTIICHGYVSRELLLKQINEYDIFVLPSIWYENAPLSILEAANFGLPVMVPNYGGLKEMASLTNSFFMFDYTSGNVDKYIHAAIHEVGKNYIKDPYEFTFDNYK
ncbi:TPA: glycosyltransferase family 4 protein, partial [Klebsiella pneumoniae]|nr:glycosyltransferase family 4 protein [Klebsiella pneumoniae]